ncbi:hypothetical protein CERSUDRAFT_75316 [Gelatoporia subvermispora B]|uniref:Uncharacterized protein n=1 Tax=Ceriporiopsis subvermispora (strain B) TaxID=914234 RepID=M2PG96_CERS8|nr:hypothetical protein CERSUDRAFT_75316 [Gelatoporia subvermispora B]
MTEEKLYIAAAFDITQMLNLGSWPLLACWDGSEMKGISPLCVDKKARTAERAKVRVSKMPPYETALRLSAAPQNGDVDSSDSSESSDSESSDKDQESDESNTESYNEPQDAGSQMSAAVPSSGIEPSTEAQDDESDIAWHDQYLDNRYPVALILFWPHIRLSEDPCTSIARMVDPDRDLESLFICMRVKYTKYLPYQLEGNIPNREMMMTFHAREEYSVKFETNLAHLKGVTEEYPVARFVNNITWREIQAYYKPLRRPQRAIVMYFYAGRKLWT